MSSKSGTAATLKVRQVRSGIGFDRNQKATLRALGFKKLQTVRELPDRPEVRAMVAKISHLLVIEE